MKKVLALIISLALVLSCLPGAAVAEKYKSNLLKKTLKLPSKMALVDEQKLEDGSVQLAIAIETQPDAMIYTTVKKVKEFKGYTMSTLPDEQLNAWTEYYYQYYPENATAGRLPSNSGAGDPLYCYCGQNANGGSILVYGSVMNQIYVSSYCVSASGGFSKATMQGTLEALNAVNAAFGKSSASANGGKASDYVFSHDDYDVVVVFFLLDDDDIDLYEDDDFDWDDDDWDDDDDFDWDDDDDFDWDDDEDDDWNLDDDDDDWDTGDDDDWDTGDDDDWDTGDDYSDYDDGDYGDYDDGGYDDYE